MEERNVVHSREPRLSRIPTRTACGLPSTYRQYRVSASEFEKLTTPPAPWCPECRIALDLLDEERREEERLEAEATYLEDGRQRDLYYSGRA